VTVFVKEFYVIKHDIEKGIPDRDLLHETAWKASD